MRDGALADALGQHSGGIQFRRPVRGLGGLRCRGAGVGPRPETLTRVATAKPPSHGAMIGRRGSAGPGPRMLVKANLDDDWTETETSVVLSNFERWNVQMNQPITRVSQALPEE